MKEMRRNIRLLGILLLCGFIGLGSWFGYTVYSQGARWLTNQYNPRLNSAKKKVTMGNITDRNGVMLATSDEAGNRVYASDSATRRALSQTVGDQLGMSGTGVETFHAGTLLGFSGSIIDRTWQWLKGGEYRGEDIRLTVDAQLTRYISKAFPDGYDGAVVMLNYKTGEILAMVSKPDYDPAKVDNRSASSTGTAFLNRVLQGQYTPGSVFKIVTCAAALESLEGVTFRSFECEGSRVYGEGKVTDAGGGKPHGALSLEEAFAKSCNVTFAGLGYELGMDRLFRKASAMGFNDNFKFRDIVLYESSFPQTAADVHELAWSGVGQGKVLVTPMHMAMIASSVANGGQMMEPRLIAAVTGVGNLPKQFLTSSVYRRAMDASIASVLKEYMREAVKSGTATRSQVKGYQVCGKTGTAEVSDDKSVANNAWYVGFLDEEAYPYAIAVVVEKGGSGGDKAARLASKALAKAIELSK